MVQLALGDEFLLPSRKRLLGECEFFGERFDQRLRVACELSLQVFDLILKTCDELEDGLWSLIIESENGGMAENGDPLPLWTNEIG
jgi:hypothetical protein